MIKWGILGAGKIAEKFISDFAYVTNGEVVAIGSRSPEKAAEMAKKYRIEKSYGSYHDLLSDPEVEVVYVATPHNFHFEHSRLCFEFGKHVLCEKPVTINAKQFVLLTIEAKKRNLFLMEAMWTAFNPSIVQVQKWLQEKKLGTIHFIQAEFGFLGNSDPGARLFNPGLAGGALLDIGIYPLTFAVLAAQSEIDDIQVQVIKSETGIDASNQIQIKFTNGILAQLSSSFLVTLQNRGIIYGEKGRIEIPEFWKAKKATLITNEGIESFNDPSESWGYCHEIEHVNEQLLQNRRESPVMPFDRSLHMLKLLDSIRNQMIIKYPME